MDYLQEIHTVGLPSWCAIFVSAAISFRHLTGHGPGYSSDRLPRMLTSRITATSNAVYTVTNTFGRMGVLTVGDGPPDRLMPGRGPYRELVMQEMSRLAQHAA